MGRYWLAADKDEDAHEPEDHRPRVFTSKGSGGHGAEVNMWAVERLLEKATNWSFHLLEALRQLAEELRNISARDALDELYLKSRR